MFKKIKIKEWRQFQNIEIDFHDRLTILTGANGVGKTTLLNLLNRHFGWSMNFVSTPKRDVENGIVKYFTGFWNILTGNSPPQTHNGIGVITYQNNVTANLTVPVSVGSVFGVDINNQQSVEGLHIPSHRALFAYQHIGNIPTSVPRKEDIINNYITSFRQQYAHGSISPSNVHIKQALISLAVFGEGNTSVTPNKEALALFRDFQDVLKKVLPPNLGFSKIVVEMPEIVLHTNTGDFSLDTVSGGIGALIDLAWQIFMGTISSKKYVVTIDEPENHLHPEMQRTLLPNFLKAFPNIQFVVTTHSPFIVSSEPNSNVYVLKYDESGKVISVFLENVNKAGSSNEILQDVLGLSSASPLWVEKKIDEIISKFSEMDFTEQTLTQFRLEMKEIGLERIIPETIANIRNKR